MLKQQIQSVISELIDTSVIQLSQIPDIQLYMEQVTTFVEEGLNASDKPLTKTMINNYTKAGLITPPVKKKYNKNNIISLILIYNFKNILSITDIKELLTSFEPEKINDYYNFFIKIQTLESDNLAESFSNEAIKLFPENTDEKTVYLLTAIMLINQANIRKQIAEKLINKYLATEDKKK